jgi:hypothetical protein
MSSAKIRVPAEAWLCKALAILLALPPSIGAQAPATSPQANPPAQTAPMAPLPTVQDLKVVALAGNDEMNDLERRVMAPLVVQVVDQNSRPVEGADVVFRFPLTGPGATFANGQTSKKVRTDGRGQAAAMGWLANGQVGTFQVHVTASYSNETGETTVSMQNVTRIVDQGKRTGGKRTSWWSSPWVKVAVIGGAAAAVAGIVLGTRGGSSSSSGHTVTITPGPPTVGGPH